MSIRPIDMQIAIQKSDHYTKEFNYDNKTSNIQQGISIDTQKQVAQGQRQVVSAEASKNNRIDKEGSNESGTKDHYPKNRKGNLEVDSDEKIALIEDDKGAFIDISI